MTNTSRNGRRSRDPEARIPKLLMVTSITVGNGIGYSAMAALVPRSKESPLAK